MIKMIVMAALASVLGGLLTTGACIVVSKETVEAAGRAVTSAQQQRKKLDQQFNFAPPADGKMSGAALERFLKVRKAIMASVLDKPVSGLPPLNADTLGSPMQSLRTTLDHQMKERVQAMMKSMETNGVSPAEYVWDVRAVYGSVFAAAAAGKADGQALAKKIEGLLPASVGKLGKYTGSIDVQEMLGKGGVIDSELLKHIDKNQEELFKREMLMVDVVAAGFLGATGAAPQLK